MVVSSLQYGENTAFSPAFPLAGFMAEAFCWLFPRNAIEKGINLFLWHSLFFMGFSLLGIRSIRNKKPPVIWVVIICGTVIERELCYTVQWIESFLWVLAVALWLRHLIDFLLRTPRLCRHFRDAKRFCWVCGCFISTMRWKYGLFLRFSPWRNPRLRHVIG